MALRGGALDIGPQESIPKEYQNADPNFVYYARQYGAWPPGRYARGSRGEAQEKKIYQQINDFLFNQYKLREQMQQRRDLQTERLQTQGAERAETRQAMTEDREARNQAYRERTENQKMVNLQLLLSDPAVDKDTKAFALNEIKKSVGVPTTPTGATTVAAGGPKGEYGPADLKKPPAGGVPAPAPAPAPAAGGYTPVSGAFAPGGQDEFTLRSAGGGGMGTGTYGPGTLGSPYGLDYSGPVDASGQPGAATAGPWTVRGRPGPDRPLAPGAFARSLGFQTQNELERGMSAAMMADVMRQPIPIGESGVEALADIGGAGAQKAVQALYRAEPGATIGYPDVFTSPTPGKGGTISGASTYLPQEGEVFLPSIKTARGGPERIGEVLGPPGYDPNIDPRYAAGILSETNPALAQQYADIAKGKTFRTAPATPEEQLTGRKEHVFMESKPGYTPAAGTFGGGGTAVIPQTQPTTTPGTKPYDIYAQRAQQEMERNKQLVAEQERIRQLWEQEMRRRVGETGRPIPFTGYRQGEPF